MLGFDNPKSMHLFMHSFIEEIFADIIIYKKEYIKFGLVPTSERVPKPFAKC